MSNIFKKSLVRGFTLIELLVVIAIIGLLSTVIAAPITQARKKGRDGKKVADLHQIQGALQQYADDHLGNYADYLSQMVPTYLSVLPPFAASSTPAKDKYMYTAYVTSDQRVVSFHLGAKLEAPSQALGDDRDCYGAGPIDTDHNFCVDSSQSPDGMFSTSTTSPNFTTTDNQVASDPSTLGMVGLSMPSNNGITAPFDHMHNTDFSDFGGGTDAANTACTANINASNTACVYDITN